MPRNMQRESRTKAADSSQQDSRQTSVFSHQTQSGFLRLPLELQKTIVEYVTRKSDMASIRAASKELQALILPYLFHHVNLEVEAMNQFLFLRWRSDHSGLPHIRSLHIKDNTFHPKFKPAEHMPVFRRFLSLIPNDSLRVFQFSTKVQVPQDLGLFLRSRQQRLTNYQHHSLTPTIIPNVDETRHVTCLQLSIKERRDCQAAARLLEHMPSITSLTIQLRSDRDVYSMGDIHEVGKMIVNTLFNAGNSTRVRHCPNLRLLRIQNLSFRYAGAILPTVLALESLEHLHLLQCQHTNRFCESLSRLGLNLQSFCDRCSDNPPYPGAVDTFIRSLAPLRKFRIMSRPDRLEYEVCDWTALISHAPKLRCLELYDYHPFKPFLKTKRKLHDFKAFCESASQLQQLAMQGPRIEKYTWMVSHGLHAFLDCLSKISNLEVLKLHVQPECLRFEDDFFDNEDDDEGDLNEEVKELRWEIELANAKDQAKEMADEIFERLTLACPRLVAVVIGLHDNHDTLCDSHGFLRAKQTDLFGRTSSVGVLVDEDEVKYYAPDYEFGAITEREDMLAF